MGETRPAGRTAARMLWAGVALALGACAPVAERVAPPGAAPPSAATAAPERGNSGEAAYRASVLAQVAVAWQPPGGLARDAVPEASADGASVTARSAVPGPALEAVVVLEVAPGGRLLGARLERGSGDPVFDAAALQAAWDAAPFPPVPETLGEEGAEAYRFQATFRLD